MWGCLKFVYEAPNQISLNWTMCSQTKACITKSCEICTFLRYYAVQSDNSALTFQDNLTVPVSRVKKCKTENTAWQKSTDKIFFSRTLSIVSFLNEVDTIWYGLCINCTKLTLNIPSLARQRCLSSWSPRRTPWFFCKFSTVWCDRLLKLCFLGFWNYNSVIQALLASNILCLFISTEVSQ